MDFNYTTGEHVQILLALLKAHGIRRAVVSPGSTDAELVASMQQDPYFELYSCVDERSAAYMACGIAAETNEAVMLTCTESTASRNYFPGLTEAYHRKLPILAVTCLHDYRLIGNLWPQVIDRSTAPRDAVKYHVDIPLIEGREDAWSVNLKLNEAILELTHHSPGPVHINFPISPHYHLNAKTLPEARVIRRYGYRDELPMLGGGRVAVFMSVHRAWTQEETAAIDRFCARRNAVVFCDKTSQYHGKYAVYSAFLAHQLYSYDLFKGIETLIHIGEETADLYTQKRVKTAKQVWRVSEDGCLRDPLRKLTAVFEMDEKFFFEHYADEGEAAAEQPDYLADYRRAKDELLSALPEVPFSNVYLASRFYPALPENSVLHLGGSNTIRVWTFFEDNDSIRVSANCGCRGIDGSLSSMLGASFVNRNALFYCVVGDLTFFYDMNSVGNRAVGNNVRIILVNNGNGNLFKHLDHPCHVMMGDEATDRYLSAGGHFGNKSPALVKHYAEDLGFEYFSASSKEELSAVAERFLSPELTEKPMLLEVFTTDDDESKAYAALKSIKTDPSSKAKNTVKSIAKGVLSPEMIKKVKEIIK